MTFVPTASFYFDPASSKSKGDQKRLYHHFIFFTTSSYYNFLITRRARYEAKVKMKYIAECLEMKSFDMLELDSPQVNEIHIAGRSIETAYWKGWDDPRRAGDGFDWSEGDRLRGAGLVDCSFFMHHDEALFGALVAEKRGGLGHPLTTIGNKEAVMFQYSGDGCLFNFHSLHTNTS
jgi:hypothetical protein